MESQLTQLNQFRFTQNKFNYLDGSLEIDRLKVQNISSIQLHQIFKCDEGYSLLDKDKVGNQSIDFTFGDSNIQIF